MLVCLSAAVPPIPGPALAAGVLAVVNFGVGVWIAMSLTMAQEVTPTKVSAAACLLGGSGSLAGALTMGAVDRVTRVSGSFAIPMAAVAVAAMLAAGVGGVAGRPVAPD